MHTENKQQLTSIEVSQLSDVNGGFGIPGWLKPVAKVAGFASSKVLAPVSAVIGGYQGMNKFLSDRDQHKSFGTSLWDGVKAGVKAGVGF